MPNKLSNITLNEYRKFLTHVGCKCIRQNKGHEHWANKDINRPLTFQSHIEPIPEFIIKQHLRYLNMSKNEFLDIMNSL